MSRKKRSYNLHEVLSMLEDDPSFDDANIYIEPPDVTEETDEDSGEEDGTGTPSNLNRNQLMAGASVTVRRQGFRTTDALDNDENNEVESDSEDEDSPNEETTSATGNGGKGKRVNIPSNSGPVQAKKARTTTTSSAERDWRKVDLTSREKERFQWNVHPLDASRLPDGPVKLFELFFDDEVINILVKHSILYARSKGNTNFETTPDEMRAFIGVLLISGYNSVPRRHLYWSHDSDVSNDAVSSAMSRNRFDEMMRYLHIGDNANLDTEDKFTKVRLLFNLLNEKFLLYFSFLKSQNLSIDESMVPYYGRHGAKQFIRGKPIRFGFKVWVLATPLGYAVQLEPYQGARGRQNAYPGLGMGGSVVMDLVSELQTEENSSYHLTFDNLFTSIALVECLTEKNIGCTGTLRSNRTGDCPIKSVNDMKKTTRGTFDYAKDSKNGTIVLRWNDNNVVNAASNMVGVNPVLSTRRWSRSDKTHVNIGQPNIIRHYNHTMGGVDRMDQNVDKYRITVRSKKWWWPLFAYCLDLCVQQAWHLHRLSQASINKTNDLLAVRRTIARAFLARSPATGGPGRPRGFASSDKRVPNDIRYDRLDHYIEPWQTQLKCAYCGMKTKHRCMKCKVGVHDRCFAGFHTL